MAYATAAMRQLAARWEAAIGSAVLSGIVAGPASGDSYHHSANELPTLSYTRQLPGDRLADGIDPDAADAIDISMSTADMRLVTGRIHASWRNVDDPRLDGWREAIGTLDGATVIYMDCQDGSQGSADGTHLWHVHAGGLRVNAGNAAVMAALLSVVKGDTYQQHLTGNSGTALPAPGQGDDMHMAQVRGNPAIYLITGTVPPRHIVPGEYEMHAAAGVRHTVVEPGSKAAALLAPYEGKTDYLLGKPAPVQVTLDATQLAALAAGVKDAATLGVETLRAKLAAAARAEADKLAGP